MATQRFYSTMPGPEAVAALNELDARATGALDGAEEVLEQATAAKTAAQGSATAAAGSATTATNKATEASNSATAANNHRLAAAASATESGQAANLAVESKVAAETARNAAQGSATAAANSATAANTAKTDTQQLKTDVTALKADVTTLKTQTETAQGLAVAAANEADASADASAASATASQGSANASAGSASAALTSRNQAEGFRNQAEAARTDAQTSRDAAAGSAMAADASADSAEVTRLLTEDVKTDTQAIHDATALLKQGAEEARDAAVVAKGEADVIRLATADIQTATNSIRNQTQVLRDETEALRNEAAEIVTGDFIDDATASVGKTWSSSKISGELEQAGKVKSVGGALPDEHGNIPLVFPSLTQGIAEDFKLAPPGQSAPGTVLSVWAQDPNNPPGFPTSYYDFTLSGPANNRVFLLRARPNAGDPLVAMNVPPSGIAGFPNGATLNTVISSDRGVPNIAWINAQKGIANGLASLDAGGKLVVTQLPATAINDTFVVDTQAAMLALTAEVGDVAVRTDLSKSFILRVAPASTLANWQELLTPASPVQSVAGRTGAVTLTKADVGLGNVDNTSDANKPVSNATQTALNGKANLTGPIFQNGVSLRGSVTEDRSLSWWTSGGGRRWSVTADNSEESSGNVGSNFAIYRCRDDGSSLDKAFAIDRATGGVALNGRTDIAGILAVNSGMLAIDPVSNGNANIELGTTRAASTPYIDFHSGATAVDYDFRIIASGGNGTQGKGTLNFQGELADFTGTAQTRLSRNSTVDGAAGTDRALTFRTAQTSRWQIRAGSQPESGSDAGSAFIIGSFTDAGVFKEAVLVANRSTGEVTINKLRAPHPKFAESAVLARTGAGDAAFGIVSPAGQNRYVLFGTGPEVGASQRFQVGISSAAESGSNAGSNFYINRFSDTGAFLSTDIAIYRQSGDVEINRLRSAEAQFTGTPTAPTAGSGTNNTQLATTAFVQTAVAGKANTASPGFTGTPTAPTPTPADNSTRIATTAFVQSAIPAPASPMIEVLLDQEVTTGVAALEFDISDTTIDRYELSVLDLKGSTGTGITLTLLNNDTAITTGYQMDRWYQTATTGSLARAVVLSSASWQLNAANVPAASASSIFVSLNTAAPADAVAVDWSFNAADHAVGAGNQSCRGLGRNGVSTPATKARLSVSTGTFTAKRVVVRGYRK